MWGGLALIALLSVGVGLLAEGGARRTVPDEEAAAIEGGGCSFRNETKCDNHQSGCNAVTGYASGIIKSTQKPDENEKDSCGGSCGDYITSLTDCDS
jgi:hypothetical protein